MQENTNHNENVSHVPKTSKLAIFTFTLTVIFFICTFTIGFEYTDYVKKLISIFTDSIVIYLFYLVIKRTQKRKLNGVKLAQVAFYGMAIILAADWISAIPLSKDSKSLNEFAVKVSPTFFGDNLETIKKYGDQNIIKMLSYENETKKMRDDMAGIGKVSECSFDLSGTYSKVTYSPVTRVNTLNYLVTGEYLIRCYGEKKPIDITLNLTKHKNNWEITGFQYNNELFGSASSTQINTK